MGSCDRLKPLVLVKEARSGRQNLALIDAPIFNKGVENVRLFVEQLDGLLLCAVLKANDTVGDTTRADKSHPSYFSRVVGVSATTGLRVHASDVHDSERVAGDDTTLVEGEAVLELGLGFVHEALGNAMALHNESVSLVLDLHLFLLRETAVVSDVQVGLLGGLLGTSLPHVGSENAPARSKYEMSSCVMRLQLHSSLHVNDSDHLLSLHLALFVLWQFLVQDVEHALANLNHINDFKQTDIRNFDRAFVVELTTGSWVKRALIKDEQVSLVVVELVHEHFQNFSFERVHFAIVVVQVDGFGDVDRVVEDRFGFFGGTLLSLTDLVIKISGLWLLADLRNFVGRDAPALHGNDPVI